MNLDDIDLMFEWRNHSSIRSNSFNSQELLLKDHENWFYNTLNSKSIFTYIFELDGEPVGVVRFSNDANIPAAKISYLVDPTFQGKGLGTTILELGIEKNIEENSGLEKFYGYVIKDNYASIKIFEKLNFIKVSENDSELKFEKTV